ncbi:hypothetical protein K474DRAFT_1706587 [Panus rudis PR-1116 ss-1]|nr:hypothetical protein K474DRAFT_1706587 [Panus rudis PR-1116 ss-1]
MSEKVVPPNASGSAVEYTLQPTTPAANNRYTRTARVSCRSQTIHPGKFAFAGEAEPPYLPAQWNTAQHPEGNIYFVCERNPRVITEASMLSTETQDCIEHFIGIIRKMLDDRQIIPSTSTELFLDLVAAEETAEGTRCCRYYFADHNTRTLFWLDPVNSADLGILETASEEQLKWGLEELYWNHVEFYPSHYAPGLTLSLDELEHIFIQAETDQLTSLDSTFPYDAEQCRDFRRLIRECKDSKSPSSPYTRWSIARIWAMIPSHRFMTHYGQAHSRLCRDQSVVDFPVPHEGRVYNMTSRLLFNAPRTFDELLGNLWVDHIAYAPQWRLFMLRCQKEWTMTTAVSFALLLCNIMIAVFSRGTLALSALSTSFSAASFVSGSALLLQYLHSESATASDASIFLDQHCDAQTGFQRLAVLFSIPRSSLFWALIMFSLQVPYLFVDQKYHRHMACLGAALGALVLVCMGLRRLRGFVRGSRIFAPKNVDTADLSPEERV